MAQDFSVAGTMRPEEIPAVRKIGYADLREALEQGFADFRSIPSHLVMLGLIYPLVGLFLAGFAFGYDLLPVLFPLVSGFALIGPLAAIGLYEMSRRRENGMEPTWLVAVFILWLMSATAIYRLTVGGIAADTALGFFRQILTTTRGWTLVLVGNVVGFAFAVLVLTISVIAFPLILDRGTNVGVAIATSRRAVLANPVPMALWGLAVAVLLALGSIPVFVGLAIAVPVLGHATWHLYRKLVV